MPFALYSARLTEVHVIVDIRINDENRKGAVVPGASRGINAKLFYEFTPESNPNSSGSGMVCASIS